MKDLFHLGSEDDISDVAPRCFDLLFSKSYSPQTGAKRSSKKQTAFSLAEHCSQQLLKLTCPSSLECVYVCVCGD